MIVRLRATALALATWLGVACQTPAAQVPTAEAGPVEMALRTADGAPLLLSSLRGRRTLLFLFTTYDDVSQLALTVLEEYLRRDAGVTALGIAIQPDPQRLLPLYRDALDVQFQLAYDPDNGIVSGRSPLGEIPTIPTYVVLDADGRIVARHTGALDDAGLGGLLEDAP